MAAPPSRLLNFAGTETQPLNQNARHKFAASFALCAYQANAIYSFIPKNACSTMRFSLAVANGCVEPDGNFRWIHLNNSTFAADLRSLATAAYTFVILRCPFDRIASSFLDKVVDQYPDAWTLTPQSEGELKPSEISFRRFVAMLAQNRKLKANIHWRPQTDFLVYRQYDRYFDFSRMDLVKTELADRIGMELIDTRAMIGHDSSRLQKVDGRFADMPAWEIAAMKREGNAPALTSLIDKDIACQLAAIYRDDLAAYRELAGGEATPLPLD